MNQKQIYRMILISLDFSIQLLLNIYKLFLKVFEIHRHRLNFHLNNTTVKISQINWFQLILFFINVCTLSGTANLSN